MNQSAWIDPHLLQLVGLGTEGDPYLRDGRHLRWFFAPALGFPRTGFQLLRRHPANEKDLLRVGQRQNTTRPDLEPAGRAVQDGRALDNGLTITKQGGLTWRAPSTHEPACLSIDSRPTLLHFGPRGPAQPGAGPRRTNPSAYVMLFLLRRELTGRAVATAYADRGDRRRFQDQAAVGRNLLQILPQLRPKDLLRVGNRDMLLGGADRTLTPEQLEERPKTVSRLLSESGVRLPRILRGGGSFTRFPRLPELPRFPDIPTIQNNWVQEVLLLHGGLIEEVEIVGSDAILFEAMWLPTRDWAAAEGWQKVTRYYLPVLNRPDIYPDWNQQVSPEQAAEIRLMNHAPRAQAPWDQPAHPPPPGPAQDIRDDLRKRYLGPGFQRLEATLHEILESELTQGVNQENVKRQERLEPDPQAGDAPDAVDVEVRPFQLAMAAAADPYMARVLGLMHSDLSFPDAGYDYMVEADFPQIWLSLSFFPEETREAQLNQLQENLRGRRLPWLDDKGVLHGDADLQSLARTVRVISMATSLRRERAPLPAAPSGLGVRVQSAPGNQGVKADVTLHWDPPTRNLYQQPRTSHIFYAIRRKGPDGDIPLHLADPETGVLSPHAPSVSQAAERNEVTKLDRRLTRYGDYSYSVSGMDLWGRFGPFAVAGASVRDLIPPPAPTGLQAELLGPEADAPAWEALRLGFEWSRSQADLAPDLDHFLLHIRQGKISPADREPNNWGKIEHAPGAQIPALRIDAALLQPPNNGAAINLAAPGGLTARARVTAIPADEGGGQRIVVEIGPLIHPFDARGFAHMSASVVAVDDVGNTSRQAKPAVAMRADPSAPPPPIFPPGPQLSSYPDALRSAFFRIGLGSSIGLTPGSKAQVWRTSEPALLSVLPAGQVADWRERTPGQRAEALKQFAVNHREVFAPDHDLPYGHDADDHQLELNGTDRGWTVACVLPIGKTGVRGPWPNNPDNFVVIAVPRPAEPPLPLVDGVRPGDRAVTVAIAPDPTGRTERFRVYRARANGELHPDIRRMRVVATIPANDEPSFVVDEPLEADREYIYRVVAIGERNLFSQPTSGVRAHAYSTDPPEPPAVLSVEQPSPLSARRLVRFRIARLDYPVEILRKQPGVYHRSVAAELDSAALNALAPVRQGGDWEITFVDQLPDGPLDGRYAYSVRVRDPRGKTARSAEVKEPA